MFVKAYMKGLKYSKNQKSFQRGLMLVLRWIWEFPQNTLGFIIVIILLPKRIHRVWFEDVYVITTRGHWGAISLGSFIIGDRFLKAEIDNPIFMHEFGHCLQSKRLGWLYLVVIGIPSLYSATVRKNHQRFWTERDANRRAVIYFRRHYGFEKWDYNKYPIL
jgi:hypothetical protein